MSKKYKQLQEEAFWANKLLHSTGLVMFSFGNVSVLDRPSGIFAIKPSGVDNKELKPEDIPILDLDGKIVVGNLRPSSDTPTHLILLKNFIHASSVVHTHSTKAVAFAQAGIPIKCYGTTHADYFYNEIPVTRKLYKSEIESDYEHNTGVAILEAFRSIDAATAPGVLVRNHGPFTWGESWEKAIENAEALELCAQMAIDTLRINENVKSLPDALHIKHYSRKHGPTAYYGQTRK